MRPVISSFTATLPQPTENTASKGLQTSISSRFCEGSPQMISSASRKVRQAAAVKYWTNLPKIRKCCIFFAQLVHLSVYNQATTYPVYKLPSAPHAPQGLEELVKCNGCLTRSSNRVRLAFVFFAAFRSIPRGNQTVPVLWKSLSDSAHPATFRYSYFTLHGPSNSY